MRLGSCSKGSVWGRGRMGDARDRSWRSLGWPLAHPWQVVSVAVLLARVPAGTLSISCSLARSLALSHTHTHLALSRSLSLSHTHLPPSLPLPLPLPLSFQLGPPCALRAGWSSFPSRIDTARVASSTVGAGRVGPGTRKSAALIVCETGKGAILQSRSR